MHALVLALEALRLQEVKMATVWFPMICDQDWSHLAHRLPKRRRGSSPRLKAAREISMKLLPERRDRARALSSWYNRLLPGLCSGHQDWVRARALLTILAICVRNWLREHICVVNPGIWVSSHVINSYEINSHKINSHKISSHEINFSWDQLNSVGT